MPWASKPVDRMLSTCARGWAGHPDPAGRFSASHKGKIKDGQIEILTLQAAVPPAAAAPSAAALPPWLQPAAAAAWVPLAALAALLLAAALWAPLATAPAPPPPPRFPEPPALPRLPPRPGPSSFRLWERQAVAGNAKDCTLSSCRSSICKSSSSSQYVAPPCHIVLTHQLLHTPLLLC